MKFCLQGAGFEPAAHRCGEPGQAPLVPGRGHDETARGEDCSV